MVVNKAPLSVVVVSLATIVLALIGSLTLLVYVGKDTGSVFQMVNILISALGTFTGTAAMLYAGAAAKQSDKAVQQTNGVLDNRIHAAVSRAMNGEGPPATVEDTSHG